MNYEIGCARSIQIEWQYGLSALAAMIGFSLPTYFPLTVIPGHADWSPAFKTGRVLQLAFCSDLDNLGNNPRYVRASISLLEAKWTQEHGTIRQEAIGHPTILNRRGQVVQNEVFVDRQVRIALFNQDCPSARYEVLPRLVTYHVSEQTEIDITPWSFEIEAKTRANVAAMQCALSMHHAGYRPATLTEMLWYAIKYQDGIREDQVLVPWAGYSGGFVEGRQLRHHVGLPFMALNKGTLKLAVNEFLGQRTPISGGVQYLAVKY